MRAAAVLPLLLWACGQEQPALRPGDSLLERLAEARIESQPSTNLPQALAAIAQGRIRYRTPAIRVVRWLPRDKHASRLLQDIVVPPGVRLWAVNLLPPPATDSVPTLWRGKTRLPEWMPMKQPFPGEAVFVMPETGMVVALSAEAPQGVSAEYDVEASAVMGEWEGGVSVRRTTVAPRSRSWLLQPAPGAIAFPPALLLGDELSVEVAVAGTGLSLREGVVWVAAGLPDGVTFAVEVDGTRVWSRHVMPSEGTAAARIDLSSFQGRPVSLKLLTEPGPAGNKHFDYGLWGDLQVRGEPLRIPAQPDIVLIDIDTLRPDRLGCYGYARPTSPRLDAWAASRAVVFEDVQSTASWTLPATTSMLTGLTAQQHQVDMPSEALSSSVTTVATLLREAGYETKAFTGGVYLTPAFGLQAGFDSFVFDWDASRGAGLGVDLSEVVDRRSERPLFLFVHTYLVHMPYRHEAPHSDLVASYAGPLAGQDVTTRAVQRPFYLGDLLLHAADREYISDLYDAGIRRMDEQLGELLDALEDMASSRDLLVIVTSDHGEEFFEHGALEHTHTVYQELLSVPMIVRFPQGRPGRVAAPVSTIDVVPTILAAAGLPQPSSLRGHALQHPPPAVRPRLSVFDEGTHAMVVSGEKLILGPVAPGPPAPRWSSAAVQYYDLRSDPREQHDLAAENPGRVAELQALLQRALDDLPALTGAQSSAVLTDEESEQLRALGYLGDR